MQFFTNIVTEKLVKQLPRELNVVYGNGKKTKMDIYYPQESNNQTKSEFSCIVPMCPSCLFY